MRNPQLHQLGQILRSLDPKSAPVLPIRLFAGSHTFWLHHLLGNVRIATRAVAKGHTERALGTRTNDEVTKLVFEDGGTFRGTTVTLGKTWVIVYIPLDDANGRRVGMVAAWRELVAAS